jgi:AcrR family transcriptional regulator
MYDNTRRSRRSQAERTAETRGALLAAARTLFAAQGFHATSTEDLVRAAGVTRGALYHHFTDKRALFRAVVEQIEDEIDRQVRAAARSGANIWEYIARGLDAFFAACAQRDVRQILLVDGPSVLGWQEWHDLDARYSLAAFEDLLRALGAAGFTLPAGITPLAHMLHGAMLAAALYLAQAEDAQAAQTEISRGMQRLFAGLVQPEQP